MSNPFVGQIQIVSFNFAPVGWAACDGQLLPIAQNTALFSLLGTQFGGNGTSNFALPNLQGNTPIGMGNGAGLTPIVMGETGGEAQVTLLTSQMPAHTHTPNCNTGMGNQYQPPGNFWATDAGGNDEYGSVANGAMAAGAIGAAGGSQPHTNLQPYLVLNFIIAMQGIFPSRA
ncbi:MAG TPA: tail fiber protein [Candidatus Acidoferrum sp.]|nr:tail fiber protein [Candidatus Acidoferrum sp.]